MVPINAIDNALRKALEKFYPSLKEVKLLDFKVRVLTAGEGTLHLSASLLNQATRRISGEQ